MIILVAILFFFLGVIVYSSCPEIVTVKKDINGDNWVEYNNTVYVLSEKVEPSFYTVNNHMYKNDRVN